MSPEILSVEIRPGVYIRFLGIPWDLSKAEADKIAAVVTALSDAPEGPPPRPTEGEGSRDHSKSPAGKD